MTWEAYAIRYGRHERTAQTNHLMPLADPHEAMPLDYFIWLLRGPDGREIVVDTGFDEATAEKRGRQIHRTVANALRAMGSDPDRIRDVIVTHLHYDQTGSPWLSCRCWPTRLNRPMPPPSPNPMASRAPSAPGMASTEPCGAGCVPLA